MMIARISLMFLLTLFFPAARVVHAEKIRIAYSAISGVQLPLWVAQDKGLFKRQGLDTELLYIGGGSVVVQAMLGGEVQFTRASAPGIVQASLRGAELVMIANTVNTLVYSVMTRPDVKGPEDLRGKKLGVTRLGGSTDFVVGLLAKKWRFQRGKDYTVFQTGGMPQLLTAVKTGVVDAGIISPPSNLQGLKIGLKEMTDVSDLGIVFVNSPLSTTRSFIKNHRDVALKMFDHFFALGQFLAIAGTATEQSEAEFTNLITAEWTYPVCAVAFSYRKKGQPQAQSMKMLFVGLNNDEDAELYTRALNQPALFVGRRPFVTQQLWEWK